jgi:hypothetical protein
MSFLWCGATTLYLLARCVESLEAGSPQKLSLSLVSIGTSLATCETSRLPENTPLFLRSQNAWLKRQRATRSSHASSIYRRSCSLLNLEEAPSSRSPMTCGSRLRARLENEAKGKYVDEAQSCHAEPLSRRVNFRTTYTTIRSGARIVVEILSSRRQGDNM